MALLLLIVGHGTKFRLSCSTYRWSLGTTSRHFNEVLRIILSFSHEFIKLLDPLIEQPDDYKWKWFEMVLVHWMALILMSLYLWLSNVDIGTRNKR